MFPSYESTYPGSSDGKFVFPEGSGLLDMTATLGYLAASTTRLRLGTGIRILPQANPVYTAKEYATLDFISGGRIDLGVGVGWSWEEFEACGVPWERRGARCDEYIEVMRTLWCDERSAYDGEFYQLPECLMYPKPVQAPMIPITVGGHSAGALRRAARYGAGWYGINLSPEETAEIVGRLNRCMEEEGRGAGDLRVVIGATGEQIQPDLIEAYAEAGCGRGPGALSAPEREVAGALSRQPDPVPRGRATLLRLASASHPRTSVFGATGRGARPVHSRPPS